MKRQILNLLVLVFTFQCDKSSGLPSNRDTFYSVNEIDTLPVLYKPANEKLFEAYIIEVPLPFTFNFYGSEYRTLYVTEDGWITFEISSIIQSAWSDGELPHSALPNAVIAPWWGDQIAHSIFYGSGLQIDSFVIDFYNFTSEHDSSVVSRYQVILYNTTNHFDIVIGSAVSDSMDINYTIGIENQLGTDGITVFFGNWSLENKIFSFSPLPVGPTGGGAPSTTGTVSNGPGQVVNDSSENSLLIPAVAIAIGVGVPLIVAIIVAIIFLTRKKNVAIADISEPHYISNVRVLNQIGSGTYGRVFKGIYNSNVLVCVKQLKEFKDAEDFDTAASFLYDLNHTNVAHFLGIMKTEEDKYIITEYVSVIEGLRTVKDLFERRKNMTTTSDLISIAKQCAAGMVYLSNKNIVHGALSARNILIGNNHKSPSERYHAKISDYGHIKMIESELSERKSEGKVERFSGVRWTAPEALETAQLTTKSDVWSFGVLLFEIFSYGETPYVNKNNQQVVEEVTKGYRMKVPENTPTEIGNIINKCWDSEPNNRPSFTEILGNLTSAWERKENKSSSVILEVDSKDELAIEMNVVTNTDE